MIEKKPPIPLPLRSAELKEQVIDLLMEAKFDGQNDPVHQRAKEIWDQDIEELREA